MSRPIPTPRRPSSLSCPTCGKRFLFSETKTPPFCSERCQLIDLGRWLNEEVSLPVESEPDPTMDDQDRY